MTGWTTTAMLSHMTSSVTKFDAWFSDTTLPPCLSHQAHMYTNEKQGHTILIFQCSYKKIIKGISSMVLNRSLILLLCCCIHENCNKYHTSTGILSTAMVSINDTEIAQRLHFQGRRQNQISELICVEKCGAQNTGSCTMNSQSCKLMNTINLTQGTCTSLGQNSISGVSHFKGEQMNQAASGSKQRSKAVAHNYASTENKIQNLQIMTTFKLHRQILQMLSIDLFFLQEKSLFCLLYSILCGYVLKYTISTFCVTIHFFSHH